MMVSGGKKVAIVIGSISDENIMKNTGCFERVWCGI